MINSLILGKYIFNFLSTDEDIKNIVGKKIFPLVVAHDVDYPFIVFSRTNVNPSYLSKDGITQDAVIVEISAVSDNYNKSCDIANAIRKCLELKKYKDDTIAINSIKLNSVEETFNTDDNSFIQTLAFELIVQ